MGNLQDEYWDYKYISEFLQKKNCYKYKNITIYSNIYDKELRIKHRLYFTKHFIKRWDGTRMAIVCKKKGCIRLGQGNKHLCKHHGGWKYRAKKDYDIVKDLCYNYTRFDIMRLIPDNLDEF